MDISLRSPSERDAKERDAKLGLRVETLRFRTVNFTVWDVGTHAGFLRLHRPYFRGTELLLMVVDGTQPAELQRLRAEVCALVAEEELAEARLLVYAPAGAERVAAALDLPSHGRPWLVQPCDLDTGEGV